MTKEKSKNLIKKVRKERKHYCEDCEGSKQIEKRRQEDFTVTPINNTNEIKEEKNHAITLIIVWLAILTVLAIYVSIK